MRWSVAMRQAVGYNEPRRPWSTQTHLFRVHPQASSSGEGSKRLNPVDWVALRLFGVDLRLSLAAESDSTLYGPLATYRRLQTGWPFKKASWQYYDMPAGASSVPGCRRQCPSLHLYRRTRHVGVWSWRSNTWAPINVVLHDHARKAVDQPWTSYACNWVKHDRPKNSEAVTGNLWKVNVSVSWLFGSFFFVSNSRQLAVHYVYKFVTSLIRSDRIVEYSFVR